MFRYHDDSLFLVPVLVPVLVRRSAAVEPWSHGTMEPFRCSDIMMIVCSWFPCWFPWLFAGLQPWSHSDVQPCNRLQPITANYSLLYRGGSRVGNHDRLSFLMSVIKKD